MTSNTNKAAVGAHVFVPATTSGLAKESVVNLSALFTLNKIELDAPIGHLPGYLMDEVDHGLRLVLGL